MTLKLPARLFANPFSYLAVMRRVARSLYAAAAWLAVLLGAAWLPAHAQEADPPGRVARLNLTEGAVSFAPGDASGAPGSSNGGNPGWQPAVLNRPLTTGDRLWTAERSRAELHAGSTAIRLASQTSLDFAALDDDTTQLRLAQGTVQLRVRTLEDGQRIEINTPNLAFVITQPGDYRIDANAAANQTRVVAQQGGGTAYGDGGASVEIPGGQQGQFGGTQLQPAGRAPELQDAFDAWTEARDVQEERSISARYVPREVIGYQQLDAHGDWQQDATYGPVWLPRAVPVNWAPYRAGHWSWIAPWGWTWIDDAPWGFAPSHYGRWAQIGPRWGWVPGRLAARPVYAPALVAFVGGSSGGVNCNIAIGSAAPPRPSLGWFPLAPGEAYRPAYRASPRYVTQVNHNIVVNQVNIANNIYRYQRQPAAVTVGSADDFARGRRFDARPLPIDAAELGRARLVADARAMLPRPERIDVPRLPATVLPPPQLAARPLVAPEPGRGFPRGEGREGRDRRDENRDGNRDANRDMNRDANRDQTRDETRGVGRFDPRGDTRGPRPEVRGPEPQKTPPNVAPGIAPPAGPPAVRMVPSTPDPRDAAAAQPGQSRGWRDGRDGRDERDRPGFDPQRPRAFDDGQRNFPRTERDFQRDPQRELQRQQFEQARQQQQIERQQRQQADESIGQRALREQQQRQAEAAQQQYQVRRQQDQLQEQQGRQRAAQQAEQQQRQQQMQAQQQQMQAQQQQQRARQEQQMQQQQQQMPQRPQMQAPPRPERGGPVGDGDNRGRRLGNGPGNDGRREN